jgi:dienelactone hydrolase
MARVAGGSRRGADEPSRYDYSRVDLSFGVDGDRCAAWLYRPAGGRDARLLVTAPGLLPDRRAVAPVARRYAAAGRPVLLFAPRGAAGSDGERRLLDPDRATTDWAGALSLARGLDGVDGTQPLLRGRGLAGLTALAAAADARVAGVVARGPLVGGLPLRRQSPRALARLLGAAVRDALPRLGATVPAATDDPGTPALYAGVPPAALDRHLPEGTGARTAVPARSALTLRSPAAPAFDAVRAPALLTVARDDRLADPDAVGAAADALSEGRLLRHPGDGLAALGSPADDPVFAEERAFVASQG